MRQQLTTQGKRRDTIARKRRAAYSVEAPTGAITRKRRNSQALRQGGAGPMRTGGASFIGVGDHTRRVAGDQAKVVTNRVQRRRQMDAFVDELEARLQRKGR